LCKEDFYFDEEVKFLAEKQIKVRDLEDQSPAQQAGSWCILFK
jgi:hypothetical protein